MFLMIHLCVRVKRNNAIMKTRDRVFTGMPSPMSTNHIVVLISESSNILQNTTIIIARLKTSKLFTVVCVSENCSMLRKIRSALCLVPKRLLLLRISCLSKSKPSPSIRLFFM